MRLLELTVGARPDRVTWRWDQDAPRRRAVLLATMTGVIDLPWVQYCVGSDARSGRKYTCRVFGSLTPLASLDELLRPLCLPGFYALGEVCLSKSVNLTRPWHELVWMTRFVEIPPPRVVCVGRPYISARQLMRAISLSAERAVIDAAEISDAGSSSVLFPHPRDAGTAP